MIGIGPKARYTDNTVNRFKKTNLLYTNDPYLLYQDPTYLGFKLLFEFDMPTSGLLSRKPHTNTALGYLKGIGDENRQNYLIKFVDLLQNINTTTPWFFQTIEGLDQAWKRGYNEVDFKAEIPKDRKIVIGCEEAIDLRVTAMMDLYRKACFDWRFRREVVPWNLRTFTVTLYVYELRSINITGRPSPSGMLDLSKLLGLSDINKKQQLENERLLGRESEDGDNALANAKESINNTIGDIKKNPITGIKNALNPKTGADDDTYFSEMTHLCYRFHQCEWLPDESSEILTKVSNVIADRAMQKIAFSYRDVEEINLYTIWNDTAVKDAYIKELVRAATDLKATEGGWSLESVLNKAGYGVLAPFATLAADKIERLISSYAGKLLMGNIYGFSTGQALSQINNVLSGDPTAVLQGAAGLANQLIPSASKKNNSQEIEGDQKYFDPQNSSLSNKTIDSSGRVSQNSYPESQSFSNSTVDSNKKVSQNSYPDSESLANNTTDSTDIGNVYQ